MAHKKIIWSSRANDELRIVLNYYNKRNKSTVYSMKILDEVDKLTRFLAHNEFLGRLTTNKLTRVIPMKTYLIFYEIHQNYIHIVSFWDNRQDSVGRLDV